MSSLCDIVVSVLREKRLVVILIVLFHAESSLAAEGPRVGSSGSAACTKPGTEGRTSCAHVTSSTTTTYHSSEWEQLWLDSIGKWQDHGICEALANQTEYVHAFMRDTCCAKTDTPWCLIDDSVNQYWYHSLDGRLLGPTSPGFEPSEISRIEDAKLCSTAPRDTKVWSWFERRNVHTGDVSVEYIEPLVSHLRHPLALCGIHGDSFVENFFVEDRSYVLPGNPGNQTQYLFDAGSGLWSSGLGGPSLSYFAEVWQRSGFDWAQIEAWDGFHSEDEFYASVPPQWHAKTIFHQEWIAAHHGGVFLPCVCVRVPCVCVWGVCGCRAVLNFGKRRQTRIASFKIPKDFLAPLAPRSPRPFCSRACVFVRARSRAQVTPIIHAGTGPFLPAEIEDKLSANDYVVFKLDIDAPDVENRIVDYMLRWHNVGLVDEFLWEQHVTNYLMASRWKGSQVLFQTMPNAAHELPPPQPANTCIHQDATKSIADSYNYFLRLRQLGVRAHSWV